jgi:[FeFe] hydrogenase H-cluster maturation GTPase HydF
MIERKNIGIFGRVNVGKSLLMNRITQQEASIVDSTPGTTADVKQVVMEVHEIGPVKLFDTAGMDEGGQLGQKKREKTEGVLKECDLVLLIIDPFCQDLTTEKQITILSKKRGKRLLLLFNIFREKEALFLAQGRKTAALLEEIARKLEYSSPYLALDFLQRDTGQKLLPFIQKHAAFTKKTLDLFSSLTSKDIALLNIPMDEETPEGRLLRPQALIQEKLIRRFIPTMAYRMDLVKARSLDRRLRKEELLRFQKMLTLLGENLTLLITDSQAIDVVHEWTLGRPFHITTFSITMAHFMTGGKLETFIQGVEAFKKLQRGDKILIAEACNHNRIAEDIGTVQIPKKIEERFGKGAIHIDHAFGREFNTFKLSDYKLVIHCAGCMLDKQKIAARLEDLMESGVPITNYGVLLSYLTSPKTLERVVEPFKGNCA